MLDHVHQQLAHGLQEKDANIVIRQLGLLIALKVGQEIVLGLDLLGESLHCRLKTQFVEEEDERVELEGQRRGHRSLLDK